MSRTIQDEAKEHMNRIGLPLGNEACWIEGYVVATSKQLEQNKVAIDALMYNAIALSKQLAEKDAAIGALVAALSVSYHYLTDDIKEHLNYYPLIQKYKQ